VAQHAQCEGHSAALPQSGDELVHRLVAQRPTIRSGPQVDEHVVGVEIPVLVVHVRGIEPGQRHRSGASPRPGTWCVRRWRCRHRPGADRQLAGDEVAVPQPERLADSHPGLGQQADQQPVA
jgi:hypothetical protein